MSRAQNSSVRGGSQSENLTFSALLCEQMSHEERQTKQKNQRHRNIAPLTLQLRSYKKKGRQKEKKKAKVKTWLRIARK